MKAAVACLAALVGLGLAAIFAAEPGGAVADYSTATKQPCLACHTSSTSGELNARGRAFAAIAAHQSDPAAAWAELERTMPATATPTAGGSGPVLPAALGLVIIGATVYLLVSQARQRKG